MTSHRDLTSVPRGHRRSGGVCDGGSVVTAGRSRPRFLRHASTAQHSRTASVERSVRAHPRTKLLTLRDPEAFAVFYARHVKARGVLRAPSRPADRGHLASRRSRPLLARRRFVARGTPAAAWLYTIAARGWSTTGGARGSRGERSRHSRSKQCTPLTSGNRGANLDAACCVTFQESSARRSWRT